MKHNQNEIQKNLEEKFKQMLPPDNAPEALKQEVFQTLDTLNLLGDIADLFTSKFTKVEAAFFGMIDHEEEEFDDENSEKK
jgi:hypothetical protein